MQSDFVDAPAVSLLGAVWSSFSSSVGVCAVWLSFFRHRSASAPFGCRFFVIRHSTFIQSSFRLSFGNLSVVIILLFDRHSSALGRHMRRLVAICAVWSSFCRIWPSSSSFGSSFNHNTI
ncbi:hypothetical protein, partial [Paenibacillus ginsengihumi]|uniref:hypothetical protein n=1 Tax=Paenibacillus ginsengihumi TaxID=431596 RepID=UPI001B7FC83E